MKFLKNKEIIFNHKIKVSIRGGIGFRGHEVTDEDSIKYFIQFLEYCQTIGLCVLFEEISFNFKKTIPKDVFIVYKMLNKQGLGQERLMLKYCSIYSQHQSSISCTLSNWLMDYGISDITQILSLDPDTELESQIQLSECLEPHSNQEHLHSRFALEPFKISSIAIEYEINFSKNISQLIKCGI